MCIFVDKHVADVCAIGRRLAGGGLSAPSCAGMWI